MRILQVLSVAFLFVLAPRARAQCEIEKFIASDASSEVEFGHSVAIEGTTVVVGAYLDDEIDTNSGAVYVYEWDGSIWIETKLMASDQAIYDMFGTSVAISGDRLLVGSPQNNASGFVSGAGYIFERTESGWIETFKLVAAPPTPGARLGMAVALDGDVAVVGSRVAYGDSGVAFVFERNATNWVQTAKLVPSDVAVDHEFSNSLSLQGYTLVAGAECDSTVHSCAGSAYVFGKQGSAWVEVSKLTASDVAATDGFGSSVSIDNTTMAIGAFGVDGSGGQQSGAVYIFKADGNGYWGPTETTKLEASDGETNEYFGYSVSVSGARLLVGAETDDDLGDTAGSAYVFERQGSTWTQVAKLSASDGSRWDLFGSAVALSGERGIVGARGEDKACGGSEVCNAGAAYCFQLTSTVSPFCFGVGCPCGNDDSVRGCANSTTRGALFTACGSTGVVSDELVLTAASLPVQQTALVYMGGAALSAPFGDGLRCVGGGTTGLYRFYPPQSSGASGTISLGPGIVARSQSFANGGEIDPGETWYFQTWYRDPMGSPCASFFNLSNALSATFVP